MKKKSSTPFPGKSCLASLRVPFSPACVAISQSPAATEASANWRHNETLWNSLVSWCQRPISWEFKVQRHVLWIKGKGMEMIELTKNGFHRNTARNPEMAISDRRMEIWSFWSHGGGSVLHPTRPISTQDQGLSRLSPIRICEENRPFERIWTRQPSGIPTPATVIVGELHPRIGRKFIYLDPWKVRWVSTSLSSFYLGLSGVVH